MNATPTIVSFLVASAFAGLPLRAHNLALLAHGVPGMPPPAILVKKVLGHLQLYTRLSPSPYIWVVPTAHLIHDRPVHFSHRASRSATNLGSSAIAATGCRPAPMSPADVQLHHDPDHHVSRQPVMLLRPARSRCTPLLCDLAQREHADVADGSARSVVRYCTRMCVARANRRSHCAAPVDDVD